MTYPQRVTCPACDAPVILAAEARQGGRPVAFDPDARLSGDQYDTRLSDDLSYVSARGGTTDHLTGHVPLYRPHQRSCPRGLRVPGGKACPSWAGYSQSASAPRGAPPVPSWPQPWESVGGSDYDASDLLSLRRAAMPRRRMMVMMAAALYRVTLAANPGPVASQAGKRIRNPVPGDLVAEVTGAREPGSERKGLGILLAARREWLCADEDWKGGPGNDGRPSGDAWYVQYGPKAADVARFGGEAQFVTAMGSDQGF